MDQDLSKIGDQEKPSLNHPRHLPLVALYYPPSLITGQLTPRRSPY
jgi:hypothetical protein